MSFHNFRLEVIAEVIRIVSESGDPTRFDPTTWTDTWFDTPLPAIGGFTPRTYVLAGGDERVLFDVVSRMQSGAFS